MAGPEIPSASGDGHCAELPRAQAAVLAATERLLRERPLDALSVGDIIAAAGISRSSFYAYFPSKTAVIADALRRVMDEVHVAVSPLSSPPEGDAEAVVRLSLRRWVEVGRRHGALLRAVSEQWPRDAQLRALWFDMLQSLATGTAAVIGAARRGGQAPPGADARALATCLIWGYERVLHVALVGDAEGLPDPDAVIEPLVQMMMGGVYGRPLTPPGDDAQSASPQPA